MGRVWLPICAHFSLLSLEYHSLLYLLISVIGFIFLLLFRLLILQLSYLFICLFSYGMS